MIIETNGKRIAFGLEWKSLISAGKPAALAARAAHLNKARLMWHDGRALYVGLLPATDRTSKTSVPIYSAAEAFLRTPGLPSDALLILRLAPGSYAIVGIKDKRPRRGFDAAGLSESAARELYESFGRLCGEQGFAVVGDLTTPFAEKMSAITLDELAEQANAQCVLKAPSRAGSLRLLAGAAAAAAAGVAFGPTMYHEFVAPPPPPQSQLTPAQQYQQAVSEHLSDPIMQAAAYRGWYQWVRGLAPQLGGWRLTKVDCDFSNPGSQAASYAAWDGAASCTVFFERAVRAVATNESFVQAAPPEWLPALTYEAGTDRIRVSLRPPVVQPVQLRAVLEGAGTGSERDIHFVSQLQHTGTLAKETGLAAPQPFLLPPALPPASVPGVYMAASWRLTSALHIVDVLDHFPPYAVLSKAVVEINKTPASGETPFALALTGLVITRN